MIVSESDWHRARRASVIARLAAGRARAGVQEGRQHSGSPGWSAGIVAAGRHGRNGLTRGHGGVDQDFEGKRNLKYQLQKLEFLLRSNVTSNVQPSRAAQCMF